MTVLSARHARFGFSNVGWSQARRVHDSTACRSRRPLHGFTLVELLVVMVIIGILISMLLPALGAVRERARRSKCNNNVKQIGLALQAYLESRTYFPAGNEDKGGTDRSWLMSIQPHLDGENIWDKYNDSLPWSANSNQAVTYLNVATYRCPSQDQVFVGQGDYAGVDGSIIATANPDTSPTSARADGDLADEAYGSGILIPRNDTTLADNPRINDAHISDGLTKTMIFAEDTGRDSTMDGRYWADGNQIIGVDQKINTTRDNEIFSQHPGGAIVAFAGGQSKFMAEEVELIILARLAIRDDGEVLSEDDY